MFLAAFVVQNESLHMVFLFWVMFSDGGGGWVWVTFRASEAKSRVFYKEAASWNLLCGFLIATYESQRTRKFRG
jgi:hypothetical protein